MQYPAYVPAAVTSFFSAEVKRLAPLILKAEDSLVGIKHTIARWSYLCEPCKLANTQEDLHRRQIIAIRTRERFVSRMDYLRRLAGLARDDERMKEAYTVLKKEFSVDGQWLRFIHSAYSSMHDYTEYRQRKKRATELSEEVAIKADALAKLVRQLQATGTVLPLELRNHNPRGRTFSTYGATDIEVDLMIGEIVRAIGLPEHPDLVTILRKAAKVARTASLSFGAAEGAVDAAISKQKPNLKTEYLRAFGHLLTTNTGIVGEPITLTPGVRRAMAVTSTVAINRDVIVTEDDVRKALDVTEESHTKKWRNLPNLRKI